MDVNQNKKPLNFISEGVSDIKSQKERETSQQEQYEIERQRKSRKSLRDQLRSNAISKQKEFKAQVRQREGFNKLNGKELEFLKEVKQKELNRELEIKRYLDKQAVTFDRRQKGLVKDKDEEKNIDVIESSMVDKNTAGVIKKKKKAKIKVSVKNL